MHSFYIKNAKIPLNYSAINIFGVLQNMKTNLGFPEDLNIEGERIRLLPISLTYAPETFTEFTEEVIKYLAINQTPASINDTIEFINTSISQWKEETDLVLVILNGIEFIGVCGIHDIGKGKPRIGLWIKKSAQGKGYGKAAISLLVDWARKSIPFERIVYSTQMENTASVRIIESLSGLFISFDVEDSSLKNYLILP